MSAMRARAVRSQSSSRNSTWTSGPDRPTRRRSATCAASSITPPPRLGICSMAIDAGGPLTIDLDGGKPFRLKLDGGGRVHVDRALPFLILNRSEDRHGLAARVTATSPAY